MSRRKHLRKLATWTAYIRRCDALVRHQHLNRLRNGDEMIGSPIRVTPGYFRAEGWNTDNPYSALRHGA